MVWDSTLGSSLRFSHYAHNDIVQFLGEYGVIGVALLMLFFSSQMVTLLRNIGEHIYAALILLAGVACGFGVLLVNALLIPSEFNDQALVVKT